MLDRALLKKVLLGLVMILAASSSQAEQFKTFDDYVVHYSALQTSFLSAAVAKEYGIKRSRHRVMINITVQKKTGEGLPKPVIATVHAAATNLTGQLRAVTMRPVHDAKTIYYIGELNVADGETLDFNIAVTPENTQREYNFSFRQQFFTR